MNGMDGFEHRLNVLSSDMATWGLEIVAACMAVMLMCVRVVDLGVVVLGHALQIVVRLAGLIFGVPEGTMLTMSRGLGAIFGIASVLLMINISAAIFCAMGRLLHPRIRKDLLNLT